MSDEQTQELEAVEPIGWMVTDPAGNVVASGPISEAQAAFLVGEASTDQGDE